MRRTPMKRRRPAVVRQAGISWTRRSLPGNPDAATVELVLRRACRRGPICCELCGDPLVGERGQQWALHHRRGRDGKPDSHTAPNLLVVHGPDNVTACHGRIHRNRSNEARDNGWLIHRNGVVREPLLVPVLINRESRWVYFTAEGTYSEHPPGVRDDL